MKAPLPRPRTMTASGSRETVARCADGTGSHCPLIDALYRDEKPDRQVVLPRSLVREDSGDAAGTPSNRLKTFPGDERYHRNASHRIGPPVTEPSIETEADQKDRRQVGAYPRLPRLSFERPAAELTRHPALVVDQQRHDDQGQRGEHDADGGAFRGLPPDQRRDRLVEHIGGEQQETDADDPKGTPLGGFPAGLIEVTSQPPQGCQAARNLDRRAHPEADERDAPGQKPGRERPRTHRRSRRW